MGRKRKNGKNVKCVIIRLRPKIYQQFFHLTKLYTWCIRRIRIQTMLSKCFAIFHAWCYTLEKFQFELDDVRNFFSFGVHKSNSKKKKTSIKMRKNLGKRVQHMKMVKYKDIIYWPFNSFNTEFHQWANHVGARSDRLMRFLTEIAYYLLSHCNGNSKRWLQFSIFRLGSMALKDIICVLFVYLPTSFFGWQQSNRTPSKVQRKTCTWFRFKHKALITSNVIWVTYFFVVSAVANISTH